MLTTEQGAQLEALREIHSEECEVLRTELQSTGITYSFNPRQSRAEAGQKLMEKQPSLNSQ